MKEIAYSPAQFDGGKYAARAGISREAFWARLNDAGQPVLVVPDGAPSPVAADAPDPLPLKPTAAIAAIEDGSATPVQTLLALQYWVKTGRLSR